MDLLEYISDLERRAKLAADAGTSPDYLWHIATKRRKASPALALKIEQHSDPLISKSSLRPDIWPEKQAA